MADYVFRAGDLPKLDLNVDRGSDFLAWKSQWDAYLSLSGLGTQAQEKRVQALTLCLSRETVTIVENLGLSEAQRGNAGDIVKAMGVCVRDWTAERISRSNAELSGVTGNSVAQEIVSQRQDFLGNNIDSIVPGVDMKQIRILFCDQYNHCLACH